MFKLVIKEKTGTVGGWLEVDGEEHELVLGEYEHDIEDAVQTLFVWRHWMDQGVESVQDIFNRKGHVIYTGRPCLVESIALVYTRS